MKLFKRICQNIKIISAIKVLSLITSLAITPILIRTMGLKIYGLYTLILAIIAYLEVIDYGLPSILTRYSAIHRENTSKQELSSLCSTSLQLFLVITGILCLGLTLSKQWLIGWLNLESDLAQIAQNLFTGTIYFLAISAPFKMYSHILRGFQQYNKLAFSEVLFYLLYIIGVGATLHYSWGIYGFFYSFYFAKLSQILLCFILCQFSSSAIKIKLLHFYPESIQKIKHYCTPLFFIDLANKLKQYLPTFLISIFLPLESVSIYRVGYFFFQISQTLWSFIAEPLWPMIAEIGHKENLKSQKEFLFSLAKILYAFLAPFYLVLIFYADSIMFYWLGQTLSQSVIIGQIFAGTWLIHFFHVYFFGTLTAKGVVKNLLSLQLLTILGIIVTSLILLPRLGVISIALGATLPNLFILFPYVIKKIHKTYFISLSSLKQVLPMIALCLILLTSSQTLQINHLKVMILYTSLSYLIGFGLFYKINLSKQEKAYVQNIFSWTP